MVMLGWILLLLIGLVTGSTINKGVTRTIDASEAIVKTLTEIEVINIVNEEYLLIFTLEHAARLSFLSVAQKLSKKEKIDLTVSPGVREFYGENYMVYTVTVPNDRADVGSVYLSVEAVFTEVLVPYPYEISQTENQYVKLTDSHYFFSPYLTESQNTTVILTPNTEIKSFTELSPYSKKKENKLSFGPYQFIEPLVVSTLTIHYMNNRPFAKFNSVIREIEVSHWGNINVEEIYELKHAGAVLKGGFSRLDYSAMKPTQSSSPSFRKLKAYLPISASNIYYRDQIGNISTSDIIVNEKNSELELEIQPRFPLFGGWQTQFYIGYSVPTNPTKIISPTLRFDSSRNYYELKFDYFTIFEEVWVEDIEIKVILPEGCSNIKIKSPNGVEQSWSKRFTYLDTELNGGRPVITLRAKNVVEEHNEDIRITYTFSRSRMLVEPMILVLSFIVMFFVASIVARIESSKKK